MEDNKQDAQFRIAWDKMTPEQRSIVAGKIASAKIWRFIGFSVVAIFLTGQPLLSDWYKNQNDHRQAEVALNKERSQSALELSKAAIAEIALLSSRQGELKSENSELRAQAQELKEAFTKLTAQYKELEVAYEAAVEEKKKLEARIDELFKTTLKNPLQNVNKD